MNVVSGMIVLWFGSIASIPNRWKLCDGTKGTPDLRDQFVVGAGSTYNPDDSGGSVNHDHNFTTNPHNHTVPAGADLNPSGDWSTTTSSDTDTGTTDEESTLPPYHALAYIQRI